MAGGKKTLTKKVGKGKAAKLEAMMVEAGAREELRGDFVDVKKEGSKIAEVKSNGDEILYGATGRPSKALVALIERYKVKSGKELVKNTIDEVIADNIKEIQVAVNNMIKYGDSKVYRFLPRELDDEMRSYGLAAQEYFGKKIAEARGSYVYCVPMDFKRCNRCKKYKDYTDFYTSTSDVSDGKFPICKDCTTIMFNEYMKKYKDVKEVIILMSQKFDIMVYEPTLKNFVNKFNTVEGKKDFLEGTFFGNYLSNLNLDVNLGGLEIVDSDFSKSYLGGIPFKGMAYQFNIPPIYNDKIISEGDDDYDDTEMSLSARQILKLKRTWGDFNLEELKWLEEKHEEWHTNYDIQGKNRELLVQQLCLEELMLFKGRQIGADVSKHLKNIQEMMKNSDLTPKKTSATSATSEFASLGDFIKHVEKTKPFIVKDKSFTDIDGIQKIWKSIAGAIARTLGKDNEYTDTCKEVYKEHTVDLLSANNTEENSNE